MEECACVDFYNRCDEHKDLVIGPNLVGGGYQPWSSGAMEEISNPENLEAPVNPVFESGQISEKDAMGREIFWEDLGRPSV